MEPPKIFFVGDATPAGLGRSACRASMFDVTYKGVSFWMASIFRAELLCCGLGSNMAGRLGYRHLCKGLLRSGLCARPLRQQAATHAATLESRHLGFSSRVVARRFITYECLGISSPASESKLFNGEKIMGQIFIAGADVNIFFRPTLTQILLVSILLKKIKC